MFKPFGRSYWDLSRETLTGAENGGADHGGEAGLNEYLAAHYNEDPMRLRIAVRLVHPI
jgi:hypothetical protein